MTKKIPNSNTHQPEKLQAPEREHANRATELRAKLLRFGVWCFSGMWMLVFGMSSAFGHGELLIRIAAVSRQLVTNPTPALYLERGELYRLDQNWEAAEADYARAAQLTPQVELCRAQLLTDRGQFKSAKLVLDQILAH